MELMADITFTGQDISLAVCKISISIIIEFCLTQVIDAKITHEVFSFAIEGRSLHQCTILRIKEVFGRM